MSLQCKKLGVREKPHMKKMVVLVCIQQTADKGLLNTIISSA
jgi:hypothetical protein